MKLSIVSLLFFISASTLFVSTLSAQETSSHKALAIRGKWHGTSLCVDKAVDRACNDEKIVYEFDTAGVSPGALIQKAFRYSGKDLVPMGDLVILYVDSTNSWFADFTGRSRIRWTYRIDKGQIRGTCVELPTNRLIRRVEAVRDSSSHVK